MTGKEHSSPFPSPRSCGERRFRASALEVPPTKIVNRNTVSQPAIRHSVWRIGGSVADSWWQKKAPHPNPLPANLCGGERRFRVADSEWQKMIC